MLQAYYFDPATGEIHWTHTMIGLEEAELEPSPGKEILIAEWGHPIERSKVNIAARELVLREEMALEFPAGKEVTADGETELIITGVPDGTLVVAKLPEGEVEERVFDGEVTVRSLLPGRGVFSFIHRDYCHLRNVEVMFV